MLCRVTLHGESGDASGVGVAHAMIKMPLFIVCYALEDVYNMDEIDSFLSSPMKQDTNLRKSSWAQNSEGLSHSCSSCKHNWHWQIETYDYYKSLHPKCFGRWLLV